MARASEGRRIKTLPEFLVNQIAAGEVVERPASVVKELVENSLDAGARRIEISIEGGGLRLIKVADDGFGMGPEDALAAFDRHATSKIASLEDLSQIGTLGFRGEALPSIASVSRCSLTTTLEGAECGTRVEMEGGRLLEARPVGCAPGTVVEVRDLFYNAPARRKFLRAPATEIALITHVVMALALAHEKVAFSLRSQKRALLSLPAVEALSDRVASLYGHPVAEALLPLEVEQDGLGLDGFVSPPNLTRSSREHQYFILNGRPFRDRRLAGALAKAYEGLLPPGRYPLAILRLSLDPSRVDVNVHPTKQEVRFQKPGEVFELLWGSVRLALEGRRPRPSERPAPAPQARHWERRKRVEEAIEKFLGKSQACQEAPAARAATYQKAPRKLDLSLARPQDELPDIVRQGRYLGQLYESYLCFETGEGLILIDQHAAHERVLYERFSSQWAEKPVASQSLLVPLALDVTPKEVTLIESWRDFLDSVGLGIEPFGGQTVLVKRVPALWSMEELEPKVRALIESLSEVDGQGSREDQREKLLVAAACQGAVRSGHPIAEPEARSLLEELGSCQSPLVCPHGRPTVLVIDRKEMERQFQTK